MRIFILVLIPLLSLVGLYAFAVSLTAGPALSERQSTQLKNASGLPIGNYGGEVLGECRLAMLYLAAPDPRLLARFRAQVARTDRAQAVMRASLASSSAVGTSSSQLKRGLGLLPRAAADLAALRPQVTSRGISRLQALSGYAAVIHRTEYALKTLIFAERDPSLVSQTLALLGVGDAADTLELEIALVDSAAAARSFGAADRLQFAQLVGERRALLAAAEPIFSDQERAIFAKDVSSQASSALSSLESTLIASRGGLPPGPAAEWNTTTTAVENQLSLMEVQAASATAAHGAAIGRATYLRLWVAGGAGLLAVVLSVFLSTWIGRGLVRQLAGLRRSALALANERLPRVVARLRAGENVDIPAEAPSIDAGPDEIGQLGEALNSVQRTAIEAAVGQAALRQGVSNVFRSLARRSQSLLHRQLALLDSMERRVEDPGELDDLYRLDHLTTRMRRHAEGLIILSGASPARSWRRPVRLVDVLRAAVAEIEDYTRVTVLARSQAALAGPAVADTIHMIAELAENATIFSPPSTPVRIAGDIVGRGFAVEIEDRGLGLSDEDLAEFNERLASPPEFDLSDSDQLGLFVAGRLARRHGITITLRRNPFGGITAIVLIPHAIVVPQADVRELASDRAVLSAGRHANRSELTGADAAPSAGDLNGSRPPAGGGLAGTGGGATLAAAAPDANWLQPRQPDAAGPPAGSGGLTEEGLPRRVRQASLAPPLRETGPGRYAGTSDEEAEPPSPERVRGTMTAIQHGWERGRAAGDNPPFEPGIGATESRSEE